MPPAAEVDSPPMAMVAFTAAGFAALLVAYTIGLGGAVGAVIALAIIFTGAALRVAEPLIDWVRRP